MKILTLLTITCCLLLIACQKPDTGPASDNLGDERSRLGYSLGMDFMRKLKKHSVDFDAEKFMLGMNHAMNNMTPLLSDQQIALALSNMKESIRETNRRVSNANLKSGHEFMESNKSRSGIVSLESGLQYQIIREGNGKYPQYNDTVAIDSRGTLIDGTEFTNTRTHGQPGIFMIGEVVEGLAQALLLMKTGAKWKVFVPPNLAYAEQGFGERVGPNATLIFEVELLEIR